MGLRAKLIKWGWTLSAAVEMALKTVTTRPVEPVMLSQPIPVDQLPTPALVLDRSTHHG